MPSLTAVSAVSPRDVWAVGWIGAQPRLVPVVAHWTGSSLQVTRLVSSLRSVGLTGIAAVGADDVWAVGTSYSTQPRVFDPRGVVFHWDGHRWRSVEMPKLPSLLSLNDVAGTSRSDIWIVGDQYVETTTPDLGGGPGTVGVGTDSVKRPLLLHWDGSRWRQDDVSGIVRKCPYRDGYDWIWECGSGLSAIDARTTADVSVVGTADSIDFAGYGSITLHWNGHGWARTKLSDAYGTRGVAVDATSGGGWTLDAFVDDEHLSSGDQFLLTHWANLPKPHGPTTLKIGGDRDLNDIVAGSSGLWVVGSRGSGKAERPLVMSLNDRELRIVHTSLDSITDASLIGISALTPDDIWAAGRHLLARYSP